MNCYVSRYEPFVSLYETAGPLNQLGKVTRNARLRQAQRPGCYDFARGQAETSFMGTVKSASFRLSMRLRLPMS
jgi:hypothetical protein